MADATHNARWIGLVFFGVALASGAAGCSSDGITAACRTEDGEETPLYNIDDVDDSGAHPDAEVQRIRGELASDTKNCLTPIGHAVSPDLDAGTD